MAETYGLSVVHAEPVRRIAARVAASPAAGRYFAIGASAEMHTRVSAAFEQLLGVENVVTLDLSASPADPWNQVRAHQLASGRGSRGILYVVHGLRSAAAVEGSAHPYAQLNLSRDGWGASGTHLLVWLEGLAEMDRFLHLAPDLWSHRDSVTWFLTLADFPVGEGPVKVDEGLAARERAAWAAVEAAVGAEEVVRANVELADVLDDEGRHIEAWGRLEIAERAARRAKLDPALRAELADSEVNVLVSVRRVGEARARAARLLSSFSDAPGWLQRRLRVTSSRTTSGRGRLDLENLATVWRSADGHDGGARYNLVSRLAAFGLLRRAQDLLAADASASEGRLGEASRLFATSELALARGDFAEVLRVHDLAARGFAAGGRPVTAIESLRVGARVLDEWGLSADADALFVAVAALRLPEAAETRVDMWASRWRRQDPRASATLGSLLADVGTWASNWAGRGLVWWTIWSLLGSLEEEGGPDDPALLQVEQALPSLRGQAKGDLEAEGALAWASAWAACLRGDRTRAFALANDRIVPWSRRWLGPIGEAGAWNLLARCAPSSAEARRFAALLRALADEDVNVTDRIHARKSSAQVEVRAGSIPAAAAFLEEALTLARPEGLRLEELRLLHALAELPGHPGAIAAANEALTLSGALMLPRDEARALLNLALLEGSGSAMSRRRLARAAELAEALGPPRLRARVAEAVRRSAG